MCLKVDSCLDQFFKFFLVFFCCFCKLLFCEVGIGWVAVCYEGLMPGHAGVASHTFVRSEVLFHSVHVATIVTICLLFAACGGYDHEIFTGRDALHVQHKMHLVGPLLQKMWRTAEIEGKLEHDCLGCGDSLAIGLDIHRIVVNVHHLHACNLRRCLCECLVHLACCEIRVRK